MPYDYRNHGAYSDPRAVKRTMIPRPNEHISISHSEVSLDHLRQPYRAQLNNARLSRRAP